jgi:tetrathionate reductase subunit A
LTSSSAKRRCTPTTSSPILSYLERWEFHKSHPNVIVKNAPVRQPVIAPLTETATVYGIEQPIALESFLFAIAEKMGAAGLRAERLRRRQALLRMEDLYIKQTANIAYGEKPDLADAVEEASDEEIELFLTTRRHLPKTVFDVDAWKAAIDNDESLWRRTVTVLNRGGRFQPFASFSAATNWRTSMASTSTFTAEKTYDTKDSMTGEHFTGVDPLLRAGARFAGQPRRAQDEAEGYDLTLITYRTITQTKSRTSGNYWLRAVEPTNSVIRQQPGRRPHGIEDGRHGAHHLQDQPGGCLGPGQRQDCADGRPGAGAGRSAPGCGGLQLGLRPLGLRRQRRDHRRRGDRGRQAPRQTGIHANAAMRTDTHNPNTTLRDLVGGSAVFYDTMVKLVKV